MYNRSNLFDINEFEMIKLEMEKKKGQLVKGLKKLYQATIDGGECSIFHKKCDNIPNTLTVIKSAGYWRFGGFTTAEWDTSGKFKDDRNSFLFSLDKKKIYSYKNNGKAIYCNKDYGPTFGAGYTIKIGGNPINEKKLLYFLLSGFFFILDFPKIQGRNSRRKLRRRWIRFQKLRLRAPFRVLLCRVHVRKLSVVRFRERR